MGLADSIDIVALIGGDTQLKQVSMTRGGEYKGACPMCGGNDRFVVWPAENKWSCRHCVDSAVTPQDAIEYVQRRQGKSFKEALQILGIADESNRLKINSSKREYADLHEYAKHKDIPTMWLERHGWEDSQELIQGKRAITYPTYAIENGTRITYPRLRFLEGKQTYKPLKTGTPNVLYGFKSALELHEKTSIPLVLCNGEASALVGQYWNTPAFCKTGGEGSPLTPDMISQIKTQYDGLILIALDCDKAGKEGAARHLTTLIENNMDAAIVDLGLSGGGDYADFCKLYQEDTGREITALVPPTKQLSTNAHSASKQIIAFARNKLQLPGRPLPFPFGIFHRLGGLCRIMPPSKLMLLFAMSGHGKTSWMETASELWLQHGYSGIYDGREFTADEYHFRRVQRWTGRNIGHVDNPIIIPPVEYTDFLLHQKWQQEQQDNISNHLRIGAQLDAQSVDSIQRVDNLMKLWGGHLEYAPRIVGNFVEDTFLWAGEYIRKQRAKNRHIDFMVFDYLHLYKLDPLRTKGGTENDYMIIANMIKDFCADNAVFGIILAQVNKSADAEQRTRNRPLSIADARFINDQFANLTISLNLRRNQQKDENDIPVLSWIGEPHYDKALLQNGNQAGMVSIIKNSMAKTGFRLQQAALQHYMWADLTWNMETARLDEDD